LFGSGISLYFDLPYEPSKWITLGVIEIILFLAVIFRYNIKILRILGVFSIVVAGFAWIQIKSIYIDSQLGKIPSAKTYIKAKIINVDQNSKGKTRLLIDEVKDFDDNAISGKYRVSLRDKKKEFKIGQCVEMVANLKSRPAALIVGGYEFSRKLFYNNITGSGFAESPVYKIDCIQDKYNILSTVKNKLLNFRKDISIRISNILPSSEAMVATAIITGEKNAIDKKIIKSYRDSGIAHFLSISGLHMSMVAGLMFFLVRLIMALVPPLCLKYDSKKIAVYFAVTISVFYLLISGAEVPAQRAFIMTFIVVMGVLFNRRAISMNTIAWAAFFILLITPEALVGASFQMSFSAVVVLIAFYEKISNKIILWFNHNNDNIFERFCKCIIIYLFGIIVADALASFATIPFAIYHFNRIAVYTSLANLLAGPIIGFIIMPAVLLSLLMLPFSSIGFDIGIRLVGWGISLVNKIALWVGSIDGASVQVLSMPLWGLILIVLGGLWLCIWEQKWRWWGVAFMFLGLVSIPFSQNPDAIVSEDLKVIALKSEDGKMVILPCRGKNFIKEIWYEKTASQQPNKKQYEKIKKIYKGEDVYPDIIQLKCNKETCIYKNRLKIIKGKNIYVDNKKINLKNSGGISVYLSPLTKIKRVKEYIGGRIWNNQ